MLVLWISGVRGPMRWGPPYVLPLLLGSIGCSKTQAPPSEADVESSRSASVSSWSDSSQLDVAPKEGVGPLRFWMTVDEITGTLGKPTTLEQVGPRLEEMRYQDLGLVLLVNRKIGLASIDCCDGVLAPLYGFSQMSSFEGTTDRGIGIGATREEVIDAYGEPTKESDGGVLSYSDLRMGFELRDGKVVRFGMKKRPSAEQSKLLKPN